MNVSYVSSLSRHSRSAAGRHKKHPRAGFALLITITLLAFLVLILVSLASLTRVETQVASNNQQIAQARQNALMALNIALGQLQKYAGPDQRTTVRADLNPALSDNSQRNGRWTGVYGSRTAVSYNDTPTQIAQKINAAYSAAGGDPLAAKGSQAILLNWLVSGNEQTAFNPLSDVAGDGHVTLTTSPTIPELPTDAVDLVIAPVSPAATADTHALLVGPNSVANNADRVAAPLVSIEVPRSSLPGMGSAAGNAPVGRYAWWVGDENTKARINLSVDPATTPAQVAFVTAHRAGVELIEGLHDYDPSSAQVPKLMDPKQLPMMSSGSAVALDTARKNRFHDLSATSVSLLTDTYAGGLKKDLSALLSTTAASPAAADYLFPPQNPGDAFSTRIVPTWGQLRSHVQRTATPDSSPTDFLAVEPKRPIMGGDTGFSPVITFAEIRHEYFNPGGGIRLALIPRLVLWNPYSAPIKAKAAGSGGDFEFGITSIGNSWKLQATTVPNSTTASQIDNLDARSMSNAAGTGPQGSGGNYNYLRFIVDLAGQDIPPGESWVFTLQGAENGKTYTITKATYPTATPGNIMTRGIEHGYALLPDTFPLSNSGGVPYVQFRVASDTAAIVDGDGFAKQSAAYIGEIASVGPVRTDQQLEWAVPASPSKPWYQFIPQTGHETGSAASHAHKTLQPRDKTTLRWMTPADFDTEPGDNTWGIQFKYFFGYRIRWIANLNARAALQREMETRMATNVQDYNLLMSSDPALQHRVSAGINLDVVGNAPRDAILFEPRPSDQPLLSIGQLQHANLTVWYPEITSYAVGNSSLAAPLHGATPASRDLLFNHVTASGAANLGYHYDYPWLLNRTLWDRYFVSTVPHDGTGAGVAMAMPATLPNSRHLRPWRGEANEESDLRDGNKAAARLFLAGGFNINSTSEQAWRAVLGGLNQLAIHPDGTPDSETLGPAFPRFSRPPDALAHDSANPAWAFTGYRRLSEAQITLLARNIVGEVRNRGPFVSLHDFINRRLRDNPNSTDGAKYSHIPASPTPPSYNGNETIKGSIQDAIDAMPVTGPDSVNNRHDELPFNGVRKLPSFVRNDAVAAVSGPTKQHPYGIPDAYAPQFLTQADVLSAIGAGLSARSDTFTIRTYGDVLNPLDNTVLGRAWCEAVVQRTVEPLRRKNTSPSSPDYNEPAAANATTADFGRRFQIISFRWLTPHEI